MTTNTFNPGKLAALRAYHRLDQTELAIQSGLSRPTIQRLESGRCRSPNLSTLNKLAEFFDIPVKSFFGEEVFTTAMRANQDRGLYSEEFIQQTITTWQPWFTTPMNRADAEEVITRWNGFLDVMSRHLECTNE